MKLRNKIKPLMSAALVGLALVACAQFSASPAPITNSAIDAPPDEAPIAERELAPDGEIVPPIEVLSNVQTADPIEFESTLALVRNMRMLGLDARHMPLPWDELALRVWFRRDAWQMTAWRMSSGSNQFDPDSLLTSSFYSSGGENGYNLTGYTNPAYDALAQQQRILFDEHARREVIFRAQQLIAEGVPFVFIAHPDGLDAFRSDVWDSDSTVEANGDGISNFWTWLAIQPVADQSTVVLSSTHQIQAINPLYTSGAVDSWIVELIWDRLMRIGADGLPQPWAAESVVWENDVTLLVTLRPALTFHDGEPVTSDDIIFSFEAPLSGYAPMTHPLVERVERIERIDDLTVRITLTEPWVSFESVVLAEMNIAPQHIWEPVLSRLAISKSSLERIPQDVPIGSGPFKFDSWTPGEQVILAANRDHFATPRIDRWVLRSIPNSELMLQELEIGGLNFIANWHGDPATLAALAEVTPTLELIVSNQADVSLFAMNTRLPPFDDIAFRRAIAHLVPADDIIEQLYNGYASRADSIVPTTFDFWHKPNLPRYEFDVEQARALLADAEYTWNEEGRLHYPPG